MRSVGSEAERERVASALQILDAEDVIDIVSFGVLAEAELGLQLLPRPVLGLRRRLGVARMARRRPGPQREVDAEPEAGSVPLQGVAKANSESVASDGPGEVDVLPQPEDPYRCGDRHVFAKA